MFWRVSGLNTACPVDAILDKEEYTLEELMDEEELVQECKSLNPRLTEFLKKKEVVEKLVGYLVETPEDGADDKRTFKYPFTSCEIFCCEVEGIYNTMLENDDVLDILFGLLKQERPLNTILAGYFSRVVGALLARRSGDIVQYLKKREGILKSLVYHVDTTSVAEVLARLAGADDPVGYSESPSVMWLAETDVLELLVTSLGNDTPTEGQANAAEVLAAIARSTATQLTKSMASSEFMQQLVDSALAPHSGVAASHALNVCLALLEPLTIDPTMGRITISDLHDELRREAVKCLSGGVDKLVCMMDPQDDSNLPELKTTYGMISPPVGQLRLKIVDLLASLFRTTDPVAEKAIMGTNAIQRAMDMFIEYPFNNALHGGVAMLLTAFEEGSLELRKYLLEDVDIVSWIASVPTEVTPQHNPDAEPNPSRKPLRAGYCGHVTQVANRLERTSETCPYMKEFLESNEMWIMYKKEKLDPQNNVESVTSWKCGRPSQGVSLHGMYSEDMAFSNLERHFDSDHNRLVNNGMGHQGDDDEDSGALGHKEDEDWDLPFGGNHDMIGPENTSDKQNAYKHEYDTQDMIAAEVLTHASSGDLDGVLSMDDMQHDEVLLGENDASDGLLELGESMSRLKVHSSDEKPSEGNGVASKENVNSSSSSNEANAFNDNQFWPKYDVAIDE